jgi:hypothetical protein
MYTVRFRNQPELAGIGVKIPGRTSVCYFNTRFIFPVKELAGKAAFGILKSDFQYGVAVPFDGNNSDVFLARDAREVAADCNFFKPGH